MSHILFGTLTILSKIGDTPEMSLIHCSYVCPMQTNDLKVANNGNKRVGKGVAQTLLGSLSISPFRAWTEPKAEAGTALP